MHVTIKDIAAATGVHHSTVSRALAGHPHIAEATRIKVQEAAERLGYRKHPLLSALAAYRKDSKPGQDSTTIAYISNWPGNRVPDLHWGQLEYFPAAKERAEALGYRLEEFSLSHDGMTPRRLSAILKARGVCGIIVQDSPHTGPADFEGFEFNAFACVAIGYSLLYPRIPSVAHSAYASMKNALLHLLESGYKKPLLLLFAWQDDRVENQWQDSFVPHSARLGLDGDLLLLPNEKNVSDEVFKAIRHHQPDVIITYSNDILQKAAKSYYKEKHLEPPLMAILNKGLPGNKSSGINQRLDIVGQKAVDIVVSHLLRREFGTISEAISMQVAGAWEDL